MTDEPSEAPVNVRVVLARVSDLNRDSAYLSDAEIERFRRYAGHRGRDEFVAGRALLRAIAGASGGVDAHSVRIDAACPDCGREHGPPSVVFPASPNTFNLSHSGGWVALAVGAGPLGVDVEAVPRGDVGDLIEAACTPTERRRLATAGGTPALEFARVWVAKEAVLKAMRVGLRLDPTEVEVWATPGGTRARVGDGPHVWSVGEFRIGATVVGAVATPRPAVLTIARLPSPAVPGPVASVSALCGPDETRRVRGRRLEQERLEVEVDVEGVAQVADEA